MKLSRSSFVYRFAFLGWFYTPYRQVSVCKLFWCSVWTTTWLSLLIGIAMLVGVVVVQNPLAILITAVCTAFATIIMLVGGWAQERISNSENLLMTALRAFKEKFCPIIELKD